MIELKLNERLRLSDLLLSKRRALIKRNKKETKGSLELLRLQQKIATYREG